ncbi:unnamed protein product [Ilex paraguariensis]|uniref:Nuclease associated modular domain-containing protein n=1 Tax=Ilex paraguariensis TaxID=185542 RepID=A0ABC8QPF8_9AQUA
MVKCTQFHPNILPLSCCISLVKKISPSFGFFSSFTGLHSRRGLHTSVTTGKKFHVLGCCEQELSFILSEEKTSNEETQLDSIPNTKESFNFEDHKESQRRRKIGLANKGKVPWNKGKRHSAETRERIRQRTKEAMRDPKVRKKMSECPRSLSPQTKARIRSSLRQLWEERLKWKRLREKFSLSWAESIAMAAKKGGGDQQELDWDSYGKMKREMDLEQLQWAADKAKAKEIARIRAERSSQAKAEKMARLAEKRREQEQKAKVRRPIKRKTHKKSKEEKEELAVAQELKLKERLTKIHRKKSLNGQVTSQDNRVWEKFDPDNIKRERIQKEVSLADQIRAAKNRRAEFDTWQPLTTSYSFYPSTERSL